MPGNSAAAKSVTPMSASDAMRSTTSLAEPVMADLNLYQEDLLDLLEHSDSVLATVQEMAL